MRMSRWPFVVLLWKYENVKITFCSTPLGHKMSVLGVSHLKGTGHLKRWPNSAWRQVIWKDLILPTASNGLSLKTDQPAVTDSFKWGVSSSEDTPHLKTWHNSTNHFEWALTEDIDWAILDLLSLTVSRWGGQLIWGYTSSENMNSFQFWLLLHRGLFYERPISYFSYFSVSFQDMARRLERSRELLVKSGAHYVIDSIVDLPEVCADINKRLARGEKP